MDRRQVRLNNKALRLMRKERYAAQRDKLIRINTLLLTKPYKPSTVDRVLDMLEKSY